MTVFRSVTPDDTIGGVKATLMAALYRGLGSDNKVWSLAELAPDAEDYDWLCQWAARLEASPVLSLLRKRDLVQLDVAAASAEACLGLLLLFHAAEVGRREAQEGAIWAAVREGAFAPHVDELFFVEGQPTTDYKRAIEAGARRFNLRHVVGQEGLQNWMDTVYLQFGFTRSGVRKLGTWLSSGGSPQAVDRLLSGPLSSDGFVSCWRAMKVCKQHAGAADAEALANLQELLVLSPWVLKEWVGPLLFAITQTTAAGVVDSEPTFLTPPRLIWNGTAMPSFQCDFQSLDGLELGESTYDVVVNATQKARLLRQADTGYIPVPGPTIALPDEEPVLLVTLCGRDGAPAHTQALSLWNGDDDITLFDGDTGQRFPDAWSTPMSPRRAYIIAFASDLTLVPPRLVKEANIGRGSVRLLYLTPGCELNFKIELEGDTIWEPLVGTSSHLAESEWARSITLTYLCDTAGHTDSVRLEVWHDEETTVDYMRISGRSLGFSQRTREATLSQDIDLRRRNFSNRLAAQIGVKKGTERARIMRSVSIETPGLVSLNAEGYASVQPSHHLFAETARETSFKVIPPARAKQVSQRDWTIFEGDLWIMRASRYWRPVRGLTGLGAPLTLRLGSYNMREPGLQMASAVYSSGLLACVIVEGPKLTLQFRHPIQRDEFHEVLVWSQDGSLIPVGSFDVIGTSWRIQSAPGNENIRALSIRYKGDRVASWWQEDWSHELLQLCQERADTVADTLLDFHLPVLAGRHRRSVRQCAQAFPNAFLVRWLTKIDSSGSSSAEWSAGWRSALRRIYGNWRPDVETSVHLLKDLCGEDILSRDGVFHCIRMLNMISPILMGRVISRWLHQEIAQRKSPKEAVQVLQDSLCLVAHEGDLMRARKQMEELAVKVASLISSGPAAESEFLKRQLLRPAMLLLAGQSGLRTIENENLSTALHLEDFRQLLALHVLDWLLGQASGTSQSAPRLVTH